MCAFYYLIKFLFGIICHLFSLLLKSLKKSILNVITEHGTWKIFRSKSSRFW